MQLMKTQHYMVMALLCASTTLGWGQLPKLNSGSIKAPSGDKVKSTVTKTAEDAGGDAAQTRASMEATCKRIEENMGKNEWSSETTVYNIVAAMKTLATDVNKCSTSNNPAEKVVGKQYLDKYNDYLTTYQSKSDMAKQVINPPLPEATQKSAHEAFNKVVYAYRLLKNTDSKPKNSWGDQSFVDEIKKNVDAIQSGASAYLSIDKDNYGKVERYTEAAKAYERLWEERKLLPAKRDEATQFMAAHGDPFSVMNRAGKEFTDHDAFLKAVEAFAWAEMRTHVRFMNEWEFKPSGGYAGVANEMQGWVDAWPGKAKADIAHQLATAKANASNAKHAYTQWQSAERHLALSKAAALIYPEDGPLTASVAGAQSLRDEKFKKYDAETFTSDYHRSHVGTVGMSATGVVGFKPLTSLKAGDKVVFTVFLDRPVELLSEQGGMWFSLEGIWDHKEDFHFQVDPADMGKAYANIVLFSDKAYNEKTHEAEEAILRELCMAEGKTVQPTLICKLSSNVADGGLKPLKFSFDGSNTAGIGSYRTRWTGLNAKRLAAVTIPKAVTSNGGLEADFGKVFQEHYGNQDVKSVLRVNLAAADWGVVRNKLTGIVVAREHSAYVVYKRIDGTCRVELAGFQQEAQEYGKYGPTHWDGVVDNFEVHCGNVNK